MTTADVTGTTQPTSEDTLFGLLEDQARLAEEAAAKLLATVRDGGKVEPARDAVKAIEHRGDEKTHAFFEALNATLLKPHDRETLSRLARRLDDILDFTFATVNHLHLYEITRFPDDLQKIADILHDQSRLLVETVRGLRDPSVHDMVRANIVRVHELENAADDVTNAAKARLFHEDDVELILKLKDVYEYLEIATDKCEDAADVIGDVFARHAGF